MSLSTFFAQTFHLGARTEEDRLREEVERKLKAFKPHYTPARRAALAKLVPRHEFHGADVQNPPLED
jgi:hypothetical protein